MKITRRGFLASTGALAALAASARASLADDLTPGLYPLKIDTHRDGLLYLPAGYRPDVPAPLAVVFHGAGGSGRSADYTFAMADALGLIVLAPDSRDERTWDLILGDIGPDVEFLGEALRQTLRRCAVDRNRLTLMGHSDGASYALSFGIGAGDVFHRIVAFSPGVMTPVAAIGKPRLFISHGISDPVMPIDETSRKFVPRLTNLGYDVTYREYDGRHGVPPPIVRDAFDWLGR